MIDELKQDIERVFRRKQCHYPERYTGIMIVYLIYLKYLCEIGKYSYEDIIHSKEILTFPERVAFLNRVFGDDCSSFHSIIRNYTDISAKEMALLFVQSLDGIIPLYEKEEEILFIDNNRMSGFFNRDESILYFDVRGKTTYVLESQSRLSPHLEIYKALNEILNLGNQFIEEEKIDFRKYHYLCILDNSPKYRFLESENNQYEKIKKYVYMVDNVLLYTKYNKISNFQDGRPIARYLKNIILSKDNAILWFSDLKREEKTDNIKNPIRREISIVNYDQLKNPSFEELKKVLEKKRKQKNILTKTSYMEILSNNMRIGFNLYQLGKDDISHDINKIVDQNTRLLNRLNSINETVELEINKLLNR